MGPHTLGFPFDADIYQHFSNLAISSQFQFYIGDRIKQQI